MREIGVIESYQGVVNDWQQRFSNFDVIEPLFPVQPLHHFGDPGHLNTEGNEYFQQVYPDLLANGIIDNK